MSSSHLNWGSAHAARDKWEPTNIPNKSGSPEHPRASAATQGTLLNPQPPLGDLRRGPETSWEVCGGGVTALSRPALSAGVGNKVPQSLGQVLEPPRVNPTVPLE